jgi:hypothetical protein
MNFNRSLVMASFLSLSTLVGCATVGAPSSSTGQTSAAQSQLVVEVPNAPPPPKDEAKPTTPEPGHIWVAGYWDYIDGHHVWRDGRWLAGKPGYEYVRARYENVGGAWQFHVPHWKRRAATQSTFTAQAR